MKNEEEKIEAFLNEKRTLKDLSRRTGVLLMNVDNIDLKLTALARLLLKKGVITEEESSDEVQNVLEEVMRKQQEI